MLLHKRLRIQHMVWALAVALLTLPGCTGAELALLGAAGAAAESTEAVARRGRFNAAHHAAFEEVKAAARAAIDDLDLRVIEIAKDTDEQYKVRAGGTGDVFVTIIVWYETDRLTLSRVSVGLLGSMPVARLVLQRMRIALGEGEPLPTH